MYHCFSCDYRSDSVREPWNCHQCGSDFVDLVQNPIPQEPVPQTPSNPFGVAPAAGGVQTQSLTSLFNALPPMNQRNTPAPVNRDRYQLFVTPDGLPTMQLQPSGNPFGVAPTAGGVQTQSLTSLFNALPPMNQRNTPAPVNRGRYQLFVTPDGRIVDQPTVPGVASEAVVQRRRSALTINILTEKQKEDPCSICFDDHSDTDTFLPRCQHYFHQACMERWLEQKMHIQIHINMPANNNKKQE